MHHKREESLWPIYRRSVLCGLGSTAVLMLFLLILAISSENSQFVNKHTLLCAKACLTISALICGKLSAGRKNSDRFAPALAGEGTLFACLILIGTIYGFHGGWVSLLIDAMIMLIGAFAGALSLYRTARKQRGKRQYRS